jgi:hypothetical protein
MSVCGVVPPPRECSDFSPHFAHTFDLRFISVNLRRVFFLAFSVPPW